MALSKLKGPAHQYMESYYTALCEKCDLGSWSNFLDELNQIYGQQDDKSGAKKEITALFVNKDLAAKDFVKYAEKFRALARLTGYTDELLVDKLRVICGWFLQEKMNLEYQPIGRGFWIFYLISIGLLIQRRTVVQFWALAKAQILQPLWILTI